jgi:hypothetical protein
MCKAGFAGDDAPRAVFRKSSRNHSTGRSRMDGLHLRLQQLSKHILTAMQPPLSADRAITGTTIPQTAPP